MNEKILSTNGATIDEVGANFKKLQEMLQGMVDQISKRKSELEKGLEGVGTKIRDELLAQRRDILGLEDNSNTIVNQNLEALDRFKVEGEKLQAETTKAANFLSRMEHYEVRIKEVENKLGEFEQIQSNIRKFIETKKIEISERTQNAFKSTLDKCNEKLNDYLKNSKADIEALALDVKKRTAISEQIILEAEKTYKKFTEFAAQQENKLIDSINDYIGKACQKALGKQLEELQEKELGSFEKGCNFKSGELLKDFEQITKRELERISQLLEQTSAREIQRIEYVASFFTKRNILAALVSLMVFILLLSLLFAWVFAPKRTIEPVKVPVESAVKVPSVLGANNPIAKNDKSTKPEESAEVTPETAKDYLGKKVTMRMTVKDSRPDPKMPGRVYCNSMGYKKPGNFTIILSDSSIGGYEQKNGVKIDRTSIRELKVTGVVKSFGNEMQIWVEEGEDILKIDN